MNSAVRDSVHGFLKRTPVSHSAEWRVKSPAVPASISSQFSTGVNSTARSPPALDPPPISLLTAPPASMVAAGSPSIACANALPDRSSRNIHAHLRTPRNLTKFILKREHGPHVHWNRFRAVERRLQVPRHAAIFPEPCFCSRTISAGFEGKQLLRNIRDRVRHSRIVDHVPPARERQRLAPHQNVELHQHRLAMRFSGPEPQRPENSAHVRRVVFFQPVLRRRALRYQPVQAEHTGHVRLRFFQPTEERSNRLPNIHLLAIHPRP